MALTTTQVQQVFLAITGRPAEGQAVAWGANSLNLADLANSVIDIRKGADFANNKDTFIENLYQNLLGRASDAEGKEFWLKVLNDGASYGDIVAQFINAVLVQNQTADLYTLQNKLGVAEQISAQIPSFTGSEDELVQIMSRVAAETKIEELSNELESFKGQNVNVANVSVNTKAGNTTATEGSEEHASIFNATVSILDNKISSEESSLLLNGSTNYKDTLNLTLKSSKNAKGKQDAVDLKNVLEKVKGIHAVNLNVKDNNIAGVSGDVTDFDLKIEGTSKDTISVSKGKTVDTGTGDDTITVKGKATVIAGAGNDTIILDKDASGTAISIDGGSGRDTVTFSGEANTADYTKVTLSSIEILGGKGTVSKTLLDGKSYELASGADIVVKADNGIDLSKISMLTEVSGGKISINDVASGTVKLSAKDAGITETITLTADAKNAKVQITNVGKGDKLDAKLAGVGNGVTNGATSQFSDGSKIADAKLYFVNANSVIDTADKAYSALTSANVSSFTDSNKKAAIAFNYQDKAYIFAANGNSTDSSLTATNLTLVGIVDNTIDANDKAANGIIEFA